MAISNVIYYFCKCNVYYIPHSELLISSENSMFTAGKCSRENYFIYFTQKPLQESKVAFIQHFEVISHTGTLPISLNFVQLHYIPSHHSLNHNSIPRCIFQLQKGSLWGRGAPIRKTVQGWGRSKCYHPQHHAPIHMSERQELFAAKIHIWQSSNGFSTCVLDAEADATSECTGNLFLNLWRCFQEDGPTLTFQPSWSSCTISKHTMVRIFEKTFYCMCI